MFVSGKDFQGNLVNIRVDDVSRIIDLHSSDVLTAVVLKDGSYVVLHSSFSDVRLFFNTLRSLSFELASSDFASVLRHEKEFVRHDG